MPRNFKIRRRVIRIAFVTLVIWVSALIYGKYFSSPSWLHVKSEGYPNVGGDFYLDLSYVRKDEDKKTLQSSQGIFQKALTMIDDAEKLLILNTTYIENESDILKALIDKKIKDPSIAIYLIFNESMLAYNNNVESSQIKELKKYTVPVTYVKENYLRDFNTFYSPFWRVILQWLDQESIIFDKFFVNLPNLNKKVPLPVYFTYLNGKEYRRHLLVSEKEVLISNYLPHHEDNVQNTMATVLKGPIVQGFIDEERHLMENLGQRHLPDFKMDELNSDLGNIDSYILTGKQLWSHLSKDLKNASAGDFIYLSGHEFSDSTLKELLIDAVFRGARMKIILDPTDLNKESMAYLEYQVEKDLNMRWFSKGNLLPYHINFILIKGREESYFYFGTFNFDKKDLKGYNPCIVVRNVIPPDSDFIGKVEGVFNDLWANISGNYTEPYEMYKRKGVIPNTKNTLYEILGIDNTEFFSPLTKTQIDQMLNPKSKSSRKKNQSEDEVSL